MKPIVIDTHLIFGEQYNVLGFSFADTPEHEYAHYHVVSVSTGELLTLASKGGAFFEKPTRQDVVEVVKDYMKDSGNAEPIEGIEGMN